MKPIAPRLAEEAAALPRRSALKAAAGLAATLLAPGLVRAQASSFPSRPIQLVFPFPAGGTLDPIMRALATAAAKELGQPVLLMNKAGAGGVSGVASLTQLTEPDGYTVALMHNSVIRQPLLTKVNWDPIRDFTYVIGLSSLTTAVAVKADAPWKTLADLLADARSRPGMISWGNVGAISANRIYAERLAKMAGVKFNMVPFKGGGESFTALLGGHLDVYGDPAFGPMATAGKIRLLATMTERRLARWPDVPTLKELGYDLAVQSNLGLVAPKGVDPAIVSRLYAAFHKASEDPTYQRLSNEGDLLPAPLDPAGYRAYAVAQAAREKAMLDEVGFKAE